MAFSRYKKFVENGNHKIVPFIKIKQRPTDFYVIYDRSKMRMDTLSYKYYKDPNYGWLIMQANPSYGSLEFNILDGKQLRIPYPLNDVLKQYEDDIDAYEKLYGI